MADIDLGVPGALEVVVPSGVPEVFELQVPSSPTATLVTVAGPPGPPGADGSGGDSTALQAHIDSPTPHPAYDDLPSLSLLFENGLV